MPTHTMKNILLATAMLILPCLFVSADDQRLPIREWKAIGPFGAAELKNWPNDPHPNERGNKFVKELFIKLNYPPEETIDFSEKYTGPITMDTDGVEKSLSWTDVSTQDEIVELNDAPPNQVGIGYFTTWVYAPEEMTIKAQFPAYGGMERLDTSRMGAMSKVWLNGYLIAHYQRHPDDPSSVHPEPEQEITLKKGWNQFFVKSWSCWAGIRASVVLIGPKDKLWKLKVSPTPPEEVMKGKKKLEKFLSDS